MKRRVVIELEVPEDFDACWDEPSGRQAAHDIVICDLLESGIDKVVEMQNHKDDKEFYDFLRTKHEVRRSVKIVGHVDDKGKLYLDPTRTTLIAAEPIADTELEEKKNAHTEHCCSVHRCKYGDHDCPVELGKQKQSFPCEECVFYCTI
jgi:hypothetical protein